jgi:ATP-binding protein involved in chromosome partitioning
MEAGNDKSNDFGKVIAVISGKGGVGKSTVAVNLAISLAKTGAKVGLIDSDFYGPSIPTLMGGGQVVPDHEERLIPPAKYGIKYISLGFFLRHPDDAVIWRGPMFNKALNQMFADVSWGALDYMIVDMPPGTGDAQLSLSQLVRLAGAVVVTTPQEVALADVRKSINMLKKVNVDVLGIIENMAGLPLPDGSLVPVFGTGGGEKTAQEFGVPLLASLPIDLAIREGGDAGTPVATGEGASAQVFKKVANTLISALNERAAAAQQLKIVN